LIAVNQEGILVIVVKKQEGKGFRQITVLVAPPDVNGLRVVVEKNISTPSAAFSHSDFGCIAIGLTDVVVGQRLIIRQLTDVQDTLALERDLGEVVSIGQFRSPA